MLELYHWEPNGSGLKTLVCLHEKGLDFVSHYVDLLAFEQYRPDFLALNPLAQVPVLVHDGKVFTESQFINEYLDEVFPQAPLRPESAEDLWRMRVWGKFAGEVLAPAACTLGCHAYLSPRLRGRDLSAELKRIPLPERQQAWLTISENTYGEELLNDSRRKVGIAVARLEQRLKDHDWLVGSAFSLADIELFAWCNSLEKLTPDLVSTAGAPATLAWLRRARERRGVVAALAHARSNTPASAFATGPEHSRWG
jgi:GSH-dependent disulfide-bond oxidoreductase